MFHPIDEYRSHGRFIPSLLQLNYFCYKDNSLPRRLTLQGLIWCDYPMCQKDMECQNHPLKIHSPYSLDSFKIFTNSPTTLIPEAFSSVIRILWYELSNELGLNTIKVCSHPSGVIVFSLEYVLMV